MYVRPELVAELEPAATGWMAAADPLSFEAASGYADYARRFAAGTPAVLPLLASRPGLDLIAGVGVEAIREHSLALTEVLLERGRREGLEIRTPLDPRRRGGVISFRFPSDREVARELVSRGLVCSYRDGVRVAPHFYNTADEVEHFMDALCELRRRG
jgi:selenocysteine lyase/cysteine desulfurase